MAAPTSSTSSSGRSAGIASVLAVAIIAAGGWASLVSQAAPTPTSPVPSRTATISPSVIVIGAMQRPFADQSDGGDGDHRPAVRSEEHTSELQSLMRISYAVFCLKKKKNNSFNENTSKRTIINYPQ